MTENCTFCCIRSSLLASVNVLEFQIAEAYSNLGLRYDIISINNEGYKKIRLKCDLDPVA